MMEQYLIGIAFGVGAVFGAVIVILGFRLGFRASYEIRHRQDDPEGKGMFGSGQKEAAEFELVDELEKRDG